MPPKRIGSINAGGCITTGLLSGKLDIRFQNNRNFFSIQPILRVSTSVAFNAISIRIVVITTSRAIVIIPIFKTRFVSRSSYFSNLMEFQHSAVFLKAEELTRHIKMPLLIRIKGSGPQYSIARSILKNNISAKICMPGRKKRPYIGIENRIQGTISLRIGDNTNLHNFRSRRIAHSISTC